jgi:hypothetical protein
MSGTIATVHAGFNQNGVTYVDGADGGERYSRTDALHLILAAVSQKISSVRVFAGTGSPALLLFRGPGNDPFRSFRGEFMQFTNASDVPMEINLDQDLGPFNNAATSMLVMPTQLGPEIKVGLAEVFVPEWNTVLAQLLPGDVEKVGNPTLRWEPFPPNTEFLNPNRVYIRVKQKLNVVLENWSDYKAWIKYWFRLRLKDGGVDAVVPRWEFWVEGGVFADDIAEQLEPQVISGRNELESKLDAMTFPTGVTSVYLLPGTQTHQVQQGAWDVHWSNTDGDVTIVFQL